jgi:uncharacterized protein YceH (UPF0502 family)
MHRFDDAASLQAALDGLAARELVLRLERRPGQKEERYAHRLSEDLPDAPAAETPGVPPTTAPPAPAPAPASPPPASPAPDLERELADLRDEVAQLRAEVAELRDALGG